MGIGAAPARRLRPGEAQDEIALDIDEVAGGGEIRRLVALQPGQGIERRRQIRHLAGDLVEALGAQRGGHPRHIGPAALVEPEDGGAQRAARRIQKSHGLALIGDGKGGDARGVDLRGELAERRDGGLPPFLRLLLEGARPRIGQGHRARPSAIAWPCGSRRPPWSLSCCCRGLRQGPSVRLSQPGRKPRAGPVSPRSFPLRGRNEQHDAGRESSCVA